MAGVSERPTAIPLGDADLTRTIARNLNTVRDRIAPAAQRSGRDASAVRLVGISKTFPVGYVRAASEAGLTDFGENRLQEALEKIDQSADLVDLSWHLVGHLQSNKVRRAVGRFGWIHSVDNLSLLQKLERAAVEQDAPTRVLVQVDLAGEATKHGASVDETRRILDAGTGCRAIQIRGLMVLPPWSDDPNQARPYFRRLRELRDRLGEDGVQASMLSQLSMGMSHDFEVAIEEGATMVRVGTAIFGRRAKPPA